MPLRSERDLSQYRVHVRLHASSAPATSTSETTHVAKLTDTSCIVYVIVKSYVGTIRLLHPNRLVRHTDTYI